MAIEQLESNKAQTAAISGLKGACKRFLQDLQALPEAAFDRQFGPETRLVADIVYEVNLVNDHIGLILRHEKPFDWPEGQWLKAPENFRTKEVIVIAFEKSSESIIKTLEAFSPEQFEMTIKTDEGDVTPRERCMFMSFHVNYHDGQLTFIQTLLGDLAMHWK